MKSFNEFRTDLTEGMADDFLAVAKRVNPNARMRPSVDDQMKEREAASAQRQKELAKLPKKAPEPVKDKYPLGGYDPVSHRSYSEEVEQIDELQSSTLKSYADKKMEVVKSRYAALTGKQRAGEKISGKEMNDYNTATQKDLYNRNKALDKAAKKTMIPSMAREEVEIEEAVEGQHKVMVTVSDPNHPAVSQRKEQMMKRVIVKAIDKERAVAKAKEFYKKKGYKVHDAEYHSAQPKSSMKTEEVVAEAKATYCGRCGTTHVPPSQGGTCPALKKEETMNPMDKYLAAIEENADFRGLEEKKLTPAEMKKREEVAKAIERENPGIDKSKKMAIATATAKRVAEETEEIEEAKDTVVRDKEGKVISWKHEGDWKKANPKKDAVGKMYHMSDVARRKTEKLAKEEVEEMEEGKQHTVPKTEREKDLAAAAEPKGKITHKDVLVKRGVIAKEQQETPTGVKIYHTDPSGKEYDAIHFTAKAASAYEKQQKKAGHKITGRSLMFGKREGERRNMNEEIADLGLVEAMISYSEFRSKIEQHRKAGNKVVDDKYDDGKASYTTIDKEGVGKKITHTASGVKQQHLGNMDGEDGQAEVQKVEKRGRGRPAGSKSGARH